MAGNKTHQCSTQGLPSPYSNPWGFTASRENLASVIAENAVQRVLYAVMYVHAYLEKKSA